MRYVLLVAVSFILLGVACKKSENNSPRCWNCVLITIDSNFYAPYGVDEYYKYDTICEKSANEINSLIAISSYDTGYVYRYNTVGDTMQKIASEKKSMSCK